jgi:UDP:flavonoid glycosyltransferase YjiC (YdhE family)
MGFVPGSHMARLASVVVSNGGSTTGYQALAEGTPVVGIPSNFDQFLAMQAIERVGAGIQVKARAADEETVKDAILRCLADGTLRQSAEEVAREFARWDSGTIFRDWVDGTVASTSHDARKHAS